MSPEYANFDLLVDRSEGGYKARVTASPAGQATAAATISAAIASIQAAIAQGWEAAGLEQATIKEWGAALYDDALSRRDRDVSAPQPRRGRTRRARPAHPPAPGRRSRAGHAALGTRLRSGAEPLPGPVQPNRRSCAIWNSARPSRRCWSTRRCPCCASSPIPSISRRAWRWTANGARSRTRWRRW